MGVAAGCCSSDGKGNCCDKSGGPPGDAPVEYEPQDKQANAEHPDIPFSKISGGRGGRAAGSKDSAGRSDDEAVGGASYFTRELLELTNINKDASRGGLGPRDVYRFSTGATYAGQWHGNCREGFGCQTWPDGANFEGCWSNNEAEGLGMFTHSDGDVFIGEWSGNVAQGLGAYLHQDGLMTYRGQWLKDTQNGLGVEEWSAGSKYVGEFLGGKKDGHGVYTWPDGSKYAGQWKANFIHGYGHYVGKSGCEFRGTWRKAVIHGVGQYTWPDGRTFCGQYDNDQRHGFGVLTWKDGQRFEGFWHEGKPHGAGVVYRPNGEVASEGLWQMGRRPQSVRAPPPFRRATSNVSTAPSDAGRGPSHGTTTTDR